MFYCQKRKRLNFVRASRMVWRSDTRSHKIRLGHPRPSIVSARCIGRPLQGRARARSRRFYNFFYSLLNHYKYPKHSFTFHTLTHNTLYSTFFLFSFLTFTLSRMYPSQFSNSHSVDDDMPMYGAAAPVGPATKTTGSRLLDL